MQDELLVERQDGLMVLTINRPQARNAMNRAVAEAMAKAMEELEADDSLRVGILTGAGGNFCTGMDLKSFLRGERPTGGGRGFGGVTEKPPRKPLLAAVEGYALAGGFELVLACDLIVAASSARFGLPEVKRGLAAAAGGLMRLPRRLPYHVAMQTILTGGMMTAERAAHFGLVNEVCPDGQALASAKRLAAEIVANAPMGILTSKRIVQQSRLWSDEEMFARQAPHTDAVLQSEDAREGAAAFAEKRAPVWRGR
ncbi:MAG TPA: crotonase/enoyl-CoA hydratase family protein [Burkholderiales bacterium]|nr:crotonase/enoyl-CoA hydratase family protein [Burkholderiales bacterium]